MCMCCVYLLCLFVVLCCVEQPRLKINVLVSTIMSLRKLVLRRDLIVENKDISLAPWLFHIVQHLLWVFVVPFCYMYLLGPFVENMCHGTFDVMCGLEALHPKLRSNLKLWNPSHVSMIS